MKKTIKNKIILSNLLLVFLSLIILMMMFATFSVKNSFSKKLNEVQNIQIAWITVEDNLYLSMNRWLDGTPYGIVETNIDKIDKAINELYNESRTALLMTNTLKKEIKYSSDLWNHTRTTWIIPIKTAINDFVISKEFLNVESISKLETMKIDEKNYYKKLNLRELIYTNHEQIQNPEKSKYISMGMGLFQQVDMLFGASESYTKKVNNMVELSRLYSERADTISIIIIVVLILFELFIGFMLSINNANRISKPIQTAANKLINFVGESLERRTKSRSSDEIAKLNEYVNLLLNYYIELSGIAKSLSTGDTDVVIRPKSDNDVMGNAFLGIAEYLNTLASGANEFIKGNYNHTIELKSEKDILARTYNNLSKSIIELLQQTKEMTRLESEIKAAALIQSSVLPRRDENIEGYEIAHTMISAAEVGGDNYDFRTTRNGNWISIGDVSGHGLEAGILALIAQSAFNYGAYLFEKTEQKDPQVEMYDFVNRTLVLLSSVRAGSGSFMTQNYLFEKDGVFYCAGAHEIGILYKKSTGQVVELKELSGRVPFMGISNEINAKASQFQFEMDHGDILVLYTDGLIEAKDGNGEQFDVFRLHKAVEEFAEFDVNTIKDKLIERLRVFCENGDIKKYNGSFADDVTVLVLKRK